MKSDFLQLLGSVPADKGNPFKQRHRVHQGWWRTAVLLEAPGQHPQLSDATVCNTFNLSDVNRDKNYLTTEAVTALQTELDARKGSKQRGLIQEPRIWNNLLSSQPLCFNFWGPLKLNPQVANSLFKRIVPAFQELIDIRFECEPESQANLTGDNSAFDVMIEYLDSQSHKVVLGLECKYTDSLELKQYDTPTYKQVFDHAGDVFLYDYEFYLQPPFNQLFRNQLMACAYEQKTQVYSYCGLFCTSIDEKALSIGAQFQAALSSNRFTVITYEQVIEALQKLDLSWEWRTWSMMLWARYLGLELSHAAFTTLYGG